MGNLDKSPRHAHNRGMIKFLTALILLLTAACAQSGSTPENGDYCANPPIAVICDDDMPCSEILDAVEEGTCRVLPPVNTDPNP